MHGMRMYDSIPSDLPCQCSGGRRPIFNVVREFEDPQNTVINVMRVKYGSVLDVLQNGIRVRQ